MDDPAALHSAGDSSRGPSAEQAYRQLDALLRVHEDLFHLEDVIARQTYMHVRLARMRAGSSFGVLIAAVIALTPVVVKVSGVDWNDAPTWAAVVFVLVLGWAWYRRSVGADDLVADLRLEEGSHRPVPLESQRDYLLERINSNGMRIRSLEEVISRLATEPGLVPVERYEEVRGIVQRRIEKTVESAEQLFSDGKLKDAELAKVREWAAPFTAG